MPTSILHFIYLFNISAIIMCCTRQDGYVLEFVDDERVLCNLTSFISFCFCRRADVHRLGRRNGQQVFVCSKENNLHNKIPSIHQKTL